MPNVIICMLNSRYIHSSLAPWCLLSGVKEYCTPNVSAEVLESNVNADMEKILDEITKASPKLVGFCCYIWNIEKVREISAKLKKTLPECKIVLGGPEVSFNPEQVLSEMPIEYVLSGEGEKPFAMLCNAVLAERSTDELLNIPGLSFKYRDGFHISQPYAETCEPPSPYCEEYLQSLNGKISYIESSRGCPFSCAFCLSGAGGSVRFFSLENTFKNILLLANSGTKTIKFVDRTFNADKKRAIAIWQFIAREYGKGIPKGVCIHFEIGGDLLCSDCFSVLSQMPHGSIMLEIGIQSFNRKTLEAINRKTDTERLYQNIKRLTALRNMHIHTDLIAGLPFEDIESFGKSFDKAYSLGSDMLQLGFLKLLHGAKMRSNPSEYPCEYNSTAPYEVISTPYLSRQDIKKLKYVENANERICNSGRFSLSFAYITETLQKSPFDILLGFGEYLYSKKAESPALFELAKLYCDYFVRQPGINAQKLSEKMVCDFLSISRYGKLPPFLKRCDSRVKRVLEYLSQNSETAKKPGAVRAAAILDSEHLAVFCDSPSNKKHDADFKDPITGKYTLRFLPLSDIPDISD